MRAVTHCVLALVVIAMMVSWGPASVDTAAVRLPVSADIESVLPTGTAAVGVAHPVVVTFRRPVANHEAAERAIGLKSSPVRTGKFEWLEDRVVQWVPNQYWPAHSTVSLSVGGMPLEFKTGPKVVGVASISEHAFTVTIDDQTPIDMPAPHHLPHLGEPGVLLASLGRPEYATPVGNYTVLGKERSVTMDSSSVGIPVEAPDGYLTEVEYAVRFTRRGLFVHSAPWAVESMGFENVSHGCISLTPAAAEWYFNTVHIGDPVIVHE